jgi:hypothetical protein
MLDNGLVLSIYPDAATLVTMREEDWTTVTVGFKNKAVVAEGWVDTDQVRYRHRRPHIHVTLKAGVGR